jgi:acyl-CoA synthetase (AMP-forming)/AMP-acid ligase II
MTGYLYPDRVDAAPIADGFLTGDIGRMTPDGLVIMGRLMNCVNVGGTKVSPEEVEAVLLEFPTVRSCLVDGEPDEWLGQRIRATVTPADVAHDTIHPATPVQELERADPGRAEFAGARRHAATAQSAENPVGRSSRGAMPSPETCLTRHPVRCPRLVLQEG